MTIRIVRLGTPRSKGEGTRIGAVRYLPRGVRKERYASENWFDVWYPELSPSKELVRSAQTADGKKAWDAFVKRFRREMRERAPRHTLELLSALSLEADFSLGCYCEDEARCHRSVLRQLLKECGAKIA